MKATNDPKIIRTLEKIKEMGMWGFCRVPTRGKPHIHWWAAPGHPRTEIARLLAHELGHSIGPQLKDHTREEDRADSYADVLEEVMKILRLKI